MTENVVRGSSKERSPNYPSVGLPSAIEAAKKLWLTEKRTTVPPSVAAQALGYNGLSGASRAVLAALRQYGLIDVSPAGITVSRLAVEIAVHDEGSLEWAKAIETAASAPDIFREVAEAHGEGSDSAINAYLITRLGFSREGAKRFVRAFRETMDLVDRASEGYHEAQKSVPTDQGDSMIAPSAPVTQRVTSPQQVTTLQFLLGGGLRAEVRFIGGEVEPSHVRKLESLIGHQADSLEEKPLT